jgi:hypothetical protein
MIINSELSAQGSNARCNPALRGLIEHMTNNYINADTVAVQAAGKLRNLTIYSEYYDNIFIIETEEQLLKNQVFFEYRNITLSEYINNHALNIRYTTSTQFLLSNYNFQIIYNVCAYDVVPFSIRYEMAYSAFNNIAHDGYYIIVIPRNDFSITNRFTINNKYQDGHIFNRNSKKTFMINYKNYDSLINMFEDIGFIIVEDLSIYKYIKLILKKNIRRN